MFIILYIFSIFEERYDFLLKLASEILGFMASQNTRNFKSSIMMD